MSIYTSSYKIMKTQPRLHISNKYNTCTVVASPVYIGSKVLLYQCGMNIGLCLYWNSIFTEIPDKTLNFCLELRQLH